MHEMRKELSILLAIPPHNNVIKMIGFCDDPCLYALVLEFIDGGSLHELLCSKHTNHDLHQDDWRNKLDMIQQIADGMRHLHSLPVIHRDLNPRNILVKKTSSNYMCKVGSVLDLEAIIIGHK